MDIQPNGRSSFPYRIIDGVAEKFTESYVIKLDLEVPIEFMYMAFLTCLGSALSHRITIKTELKPQPRLYTLLLGESSDDRKSTAIKIVAEFFRNAMPKNEGWEFNECWGTGSAEGLAKKLKPKDKFSKKQLLLCYDEFNAFVSKAKIKSSALLPCVNSLFESNRYENQIKNTGVLIENGYLSLLGASTLQTYEATWDKSFTDIGFSNRLFIVPGSGYRKKFLPPPMPLTIKNLLTQELLSVLDFVGSDREITIKDSAHETIQYWYENRPASVHSKRLEGYALRLLILMAANKKQAIIDDKMIENVIELMDWQLEMRQLHDPINCDNATSEMEEKIRRKLSNKNMSERELRQYTNANRVGLYIFGLALNNLKKWEDIVFDKTTKRWKLKD